MSEPFGPFALTLDGITKQMRGTFETFVDPRKGKNKTYTMVDAALSAFSVFFTQSPSFLEYQRSLEQTHGDNNARTLFGVHEILSDTPHPLEQGQADWPETAAQTQRDMGNPHSPSNIKASEGAGFVQPGHRQQAAWLRPGGAESQRRFPRRKDFLPRHGHAAEDPPASAVRDHRTDKGFLESVD